MKEGKKNGKRLLAILLAFVILASVEIRANIQLPVARAEIDNVFYRLGKDAITGRRLIRPIIDLRWQDPSDWAEGTGPNYDQAKDNPEGYRITLENLTLNQTHYYQAPYTGLGAHESQVGENISLATGSLYKVGVRPFHNHINPNGRVEPAPYPGPDAYAYAITDLDVRLESTDSTVTVIWDDLGKQDFSYRIVYGLGDYSNEGASQGFYNNKEGEVSGLRPNSPEVVGFYDPASRRHKLKYVLSEKIYPGQIYSVLVEPMVDTYEGERVVRNRNYPLIHSVSTNVKLTYVEEGEYLRLYWKIPSSFEVGKDKDKYSLTQTQVVEIKDNNEKNIVIFKGLAGAVNYYLVNKPKGDMDYQLRLKYESVAGGGKPPILAQSNILRYSPSELRIRPTRPAIPKLTTPALLEEWALTLSPDEIKQKLAGEGYLLNSYTYAGDLGEIFNQNVVFHRKASTNTINLVWSAFRRKDIDSNSPNYNKIIADLNTYYDIYITDDYNALGEIPELEKDLRFEATSGKDFIYNSKQDIIGFHKEFNQFYDKHSQQFLSFKPNKIYYIKLVAKKKIGNEDYRSDPTIVSFYYDGLGVYAPPVLTKPPLRELRERTTQAAVTIGWQEKWYEVINLHPASKPTLGKWFPVAWVKGDTVYDREVEGAVRYDLYKSETEAKRFLKAVEANPNYKFVDRMIDLGSNSYGDSTIKYKFAKVEYADVLAAIEKEKIVNPAYDFAQYFDDLIKQDKKQAAGLDWQEIRGEKNKENPEEWLYQEENLKANTAYMFILYPYRAMADGSEIYAHFPTPILVATKPEADLVEPEPTVPKLFVVDTSATTIKLGWNYNKDFNYKIKYAESLNPKQEIEVEVKVSADPNDPNYPTNGDFFYLQVEGLFPDTSYQFSIQAANSASQKTSAWSNPVIGRTRPILPPMAPPGFGLAAQQDMVRHKYERPVTKDSFAVQWIRLNEDRALSQDKPVLNKVYDYILEVADNQTFIDPMIINTSDSQADKVEILEKSLVKINGLVAGKTYYARVKTRLTVSAGDQKIVVDSLEYSPVVRVTLGLDQGEYDGDRDPSLEVLPDRDYELIYQEKEKSLTFRFRYQAKDKEGKGDNRVDQRLINQLIAQGLYTYSADLSKFRNQEVKIRRLELPYPVYEAFLNHKVKLEILAGPVQVSLPMSALEREMNRHKEDFGGQPMVKIEIRESGDLPIKSQVNHLRRISQPQAVKIEIGSNRLRSQVEFLDLAMEIGLSPLDRTELYQKEPLAYLQTMGKLQRQVQGTYDKAQNRYRIQTRDLGQYGLYSAGQPLLDQTGLAKAGHWSDIYRDKVASHMVFKNLSSYHPDQAVSGQGFYNGLYAGVKNQGEIDFEGDIAGDKKKTLLASGLMADRVNLQAGLSRMQALVAMVKAYELVQDGPLAYDRDQVAGIAFGQAVSQGEAITLLKAQEAGLLAHAGQAMPNRLLTYGEYFTLLSKFKGW